MDESQGLLDGGGWNEKATVLSASYFDSQAELFAQAFVGVLKDGDSALQILYFLVQCAVL